MSRRSLCDDEDSRGSPDRMSWFSDHAVLFALLCAGAAVVYGLWLTSWLLKQPAGTERMQEIARAVQEGAAAYLRRQYTTIAVVSIVPFLLVGLGLFGVAGYYWVLTGWLDNSARSAIHHLIGPPFPDSLISVFPRPGG